jgi:C-terminal processing protease CtpA/Prc
MKTFVLSFAARAIILAALTSLTAMHLAASPVGSNASPPPPVKMDKFIVGEKHLQSFGIAIELWEDKSTQRVMEMYIKEVQQGSMAEDKGLTKATRIFEINGIPVDSFDATFAAGSDLNKIFIDRKNGDRVTLEVKILGAPGLRTVTLIEQRSRIKAVAQPFFDH